MRPLTPLVCVRVMNSFHMSVVVGCGGKGPRRQTINALGASEFCHNLQVQRTADDLTPRNGTGNSTGKKKQKTEARFIYYSVPDGPVALQAQIHLQAVTRPIKSKKYGLSAKMELVLQYE